MDDRLEEKLELYGKVSARPGASEESISEIQGLRHPVTGVWIKMLIQKMIFVAAGIIIVLFIVYLLWPRSLERYTANCEAVRIYYVEDGLQERAVSGETAEAEDTESNVEDVGSDIETYLESETVEYTHGQTEFDAILKILGSYTVHKTLRGLAQSVTGGTPSLEGNAEGCYLYIYLYDAEGNCTGILSGGTGKIVVSEELCRMGYFGNDRNEVFMEEVLGVIDVYG